jgi:hypothetical protein
MGQAKGRMPGASGRQLDAQRARVRRAREDVGRPLAIHYWQVQSPGTGPDTQFWPGGQVPPHTGYVCQQVEPGGTQMHPFPSGVETGTQSSPAFGQRPLHVG